MREPIHKLMVKNMIHLEQFVESVLVCTSKYNSDKSISYAPENLIGKPVKFPYYGDFPQTYMLRSYGKWWNQSEAAQSQYMPQDLDPYAAEDYIIVRFEYAVLPEVVIIYETYNPGAVVRLWGRMSGSAWMLLWEGPPELAPPTSRKFQPPIRPISDTINELRIEFNQSLLNYHTSLDAILLAGYRPKTEIQRCLLRKPESFFPGLQYIPPPTHIGDDQDNSDKLDYFSTLPYEVLLHIFSFLSLRSLCCCSQVNKRFYYVSKDPVLYRELSLKKYWHKVNNETLKYFIPRCKTLRKLDLSWCGNDKVISEEVFAEFLQRCGANLTHLSVGTCSFIKGISVNYIGRCCEITDLRLRNSSATSWQLTALSSLKKLVTLDLYNTNVDDETLINILKSNPNLKHLIIDFCPELSRLDDVTEVAAQFTPKLVTWSSWKTQSLTPAGASNLAACSNLRDLDLGWCLLLTDPGDCLERLAYGCKGLRRLIISGWRGVSDHSLLPIIRSCKQLTQLDLLGAKIISKDIIERILVSLTKLELLEISFCDSVRPEQVAIWRSLYPHVVIQRSCDYVSVDYWDL